MAKTDDKSFSKYVGSKIRFYRKQKNMSQEKLACLIHRSKSALSKYENGQIPIDVDSLYEIAAALDVDLCHFTDADIHAGESAVRYAGHSFGGKSRLYIYYYDGRTRRIVKTLLELKNSQAKRNRIPCYCYMDAPDFDRYEKCKYFYTGVLTHHELVSYVTLHNQNNPMEQIELCILNPFHANQNSWGLLTGLSYKPITPFSLKFLISGDMLQDSEIRPENLELTKDELKTIKNLNMFLLNTQEP